MLIHYYTKAEDSFTIYTKVADLAGNPYRDVYAGKPATVSDTLSDLIWQYRVDTNEPYGVVIPNYIARYQKDRTYVAAAIYLFLRDVTSESSKSILDMLPA